MQRRRFGWIAVVLLGLGSVALLWSQSARSESLRTEAWRLARDAIQESGQRKGAPEFSTWATTHELFPCGDRPPAALRRLSARDLLNESFHYNPQAAVRLCGPLSPATGTVPLDVAQAEWAKAEPKPSALTPAFPDGARLAGVFWNAVRRPADSRNGKIVQMAIRSGDEARTRKIRITLPQHLAADVPSCGPPRDQGEPGVADAADVSLEEFFWIRLKPGERYNGAACGDFAVLMAFHLVHKIRGKWLWTTFWWDPESKEFGRDRPSDFRGAGDNPRAWRNYAMDASFESTGTIFNPWRIEERGDNCARCHGEVTVYKSATSDARITFDSVTAARNRFQ
jgi:hypothetical protein